VSAPVSLEAARLAPDPDVVELCRDLLARVESGEVIGVAVVMLQPGGQTLTGYQTGGDHAALLHYGVSHLQHDLLHSTGADDE